MTIPFKEYPAGEGFRAKFPTKSGELTLSVVAGRHFYSTPRENLEDPTQYTEVELAVFVNDKWASVNQLQKIFEILDTKGEHEYNESENPNENNKPSNGVFGWIPIEKIIEVWEQC